MLQRFSIRLFWSGLTLLSTAALTFLLINAVPGDVARLIAGPKAAPAVLGQIRERYHLSDPLPRRFGYYLMSLARGDLGHSFITDQPVTEAIQARLPVTLALATLAVIIWMVLAVPLGVLTAKRRGGKLDRGMLVLATLSLSLPAFWFARMLQYLLAYRLGWFSVAGYHDPVDLVLPALTLALLAVGYYSRLIHTNVAATLDSLYVRTARAKGLPESSVLLRHALRNALLPVVTVLGMDIGGLLGGVLFVENVFALPGIGTLAVQAVFNLDVPVLMGTVLSSAALILATNLAVDLLYPLIDPKLRSKSHS